MTTTKQSDDHEPTTPTPPLPPTPPTPRLARPTLASIVATLGPSSSDPAMIRRLIIAGVSIFRFNFSHGTVDEHAARLRLVRQTAASLGVPIAVLGDLQGPKIRIGLVPDPGITLNIGEDVLIDPAVQEARPGQPPTTPVTPAPPLPPMLGCSVQTLATDVKPGHKVLINDGAIRLLAVERHPTDSPSALRCRVIVGGLVTSKKGINTPQSDLSLSALTDRDIDWVKWSVTNSLDFLALSFVRTAAEVRTLRDLTRSLAGAAGPIPIVAKIETPRAIDNMDEIVRESDAIMVARGDLGVEMDLALVPILQKRLIRCAASWGKPAIVATQMLETMISSAIPTRAEASDVANAVLDGADAVMLSGETAAGKHPALVVETMRRIVCIAENEQSSRPEAATPPTNLSLVRHPTAALAHAAWYAVRDTAAKAIACWSQNGGTARYLSQTGTPVPIVAYSSSEQQTRRMTLLKGVTSVFIPPPASLAEWTHQVEADLLARGIAAAGDKLVLLAGMPVGAAFATNRLALHTMGDPKGGFLL